MAFLPGFYLLDDFQITELLFTPHKPHNSAVNMYLQPNEEVSALLQVKQHVLSTPGTWNQSHWDPRLLAEYEARTVTSLKKKKNLKTQNPVRAVLALHLNE